MRIAMALPDGFGFESVRQVTRMLVTVLGRTHELRYLPAEYSVAHAGDQDTMITALLRDCDVLIGFHSTLQPFLSVRQDRQVPIPCLLFALGAFPRGAILLRQLVPLLRRTDVFVVNCSADAALATQCLPRARVALIPLPYDEDAYFSAELDERAAIRSALGFDDHSRVLLYAGRLGLEKNVHTTLRVFAAVHRQYSDAVLLLAGPVHNTPFLEMGVAPLGYLQLLRQLAVTLELPIGSVRFLNNVAPDDLCALYNAADVVINMTVHHDENFGLSQVEASACGTPVIGTAWGGLRDTVLEGVNGHLVSTTVTPLGVKVNWWEAVTRTLALLTPSSSRQRCDHEKIQRTSERYSAQRFGDSLDAALCQLTQAPGEAPAPLEVSPFLDEYWRTCFQTEAGHVRYRYGTRSFELYRTLISAYAGRTLSATADDVPLAPGQVLILAHPIVCLTAQRWHVGDPLCPVDIALPESLSGSLTRIVRTISRQPAMSTDEFWVLHAREPELDAALVWLLAQGILLRSQAVTSGEAPDGADERFGQQLLTLRRLGGTAADLLIADD